MMDTINMEIPNTLQKALKDLYQQAVDKYGPERAALLKPVIVVPKIGWQQYEHIKTITIKLVSKDASILTGCD